MAAVDTLHTTSMTDKEADVAAGIDGANDGTTIAAKQPTVAAFSPNQSSIAHKRNQSSVLIHQKSPLLLATPPQVTRTLAYSYPFILPLNRLVGLLTWTSGDSWESFLLLSVFWFVVLYGDVINRFAGPLVLVTTLIIGMYARRYNPMSGNTWFDEKKNHRPRRSKVVETAEGRKSIDEIVNTLQTFTNRCNMLLEPLLQLTEFLSTQTTPTASTTRPSLTTMFIRILFFSPIWVVLTLQPLQLITTQRVVFAFGTVILSWHSASARVTRAILWRSRFIRYLTSLATGLDFSDRPKPASASTTSTKGTLTGKNAQSTGLRFTFSVFENQRRWLGLGWTSNLLSYERQAWTDEQLNTAVEPENFELPDTEQQGTEWRWVEGSEWHIEGSHDGERASKAETDQDGWAYFDNKWQDGRNADGWGRYTRRRKWVQDAELIDLKRANEKAADATPEAKKTKRPSWFARRRTASGKPQSVDRSDVASSSGASGETPRSRDGPEEDVLTPIRFRQREWEREVGEGMAESLG